MKRTRWEPFFKSLLTLKSNLVLTNGQNVPEDILEGSPLELTRMVLQS